MYTFTSLAVDVKAEHPEGYILVVSRLIIRF